MSKCLQFLKSPLGSANMVAKKKKKNRKNRNRKDGSTLIRRNLTLLILIFCIRCKWTGKAHFNGQKKLAITRGLWIQYILPPSFLQNRCTMMTSLCIEDQNSYRVVPHRRTHVPFGLMFAKYMSNKGIPPIGGLFLSHARRIGHSETPDGLGFDTGYHVIIFLNLLTFINQDELEYQVEYPLTGRNKQEGVLDEHTMRDAIDASIERGHVVEIVPEGDEVSPPPARALPRARRTRAWVLSVEHLHGSP